MVMARSARWLGVPAFLGFFGMAVVLTGCPKKPGGADAGADAGPASSASAAVEAAAPAAAIGSNDADVTKYPDQNPDNQDAMNTRVTAVARTEASTTGGKLVATLKPGTATTRIADHEGFNLVVFPDPSDATKQLEGWVSHVDFAAEVVPHGGVTPTPTPTTPVPAATGYVCVKQNPPGKCAAGFSVFQAVCRVPCSSAEQCKGPAPTCNGGFCYNSMGCGD
jgi:hypothetical protein